MHQVAELSAAKRVVTEILDDGAAIGVRMRLSEIVFRQTGISLEQQRTKLRSPYQIHDFLVRQDGVCVRATAEHQEYKEEH
jgi:hypothetical protein